jgi:hypothetical protein
MSPQSHGSRNFGDFGTPESHLKVLKQNVIWVPVPWPCTKYTIRGKVVVSPKSRPWWILGVWICPWLVRAPKVLKLCTNQFVVWFVLARVNNWCLSVFLVPSWNSSTPFYPQSAMSQGVCPNFLLFCYFHLRLTFEFIKDIGSASLLLTITYRYTIIVTSNQARKKS